MSRTYGLTQAGFFLSYDNRKSLTASELLDCIRSYADYVESSAIWNLVESIARIQNERTKHGHAMKLVSCLNVKNGLGNKNGRCR